MRAALLEEGSDELVVREIELDEPGPREVTIRTAAIGLCHTDLQYVDGVQRRPRPMVMGHESAGIVEAVGSDVTTLAPGDRVVTCLSAFCGSCYQCLMGRPYACLEREHLYREPDAPARLRFPDGRPVHQFLGLSSFAEKMLVHEHAAVRIDPAMRLDVAALLGCGLTTGLGAVTNTAHVPFGATVAVVGCGGIGLGAVQGASLSGASLVVAVDVTPKKLELARRVGATHAINALENDPVATVRELTGGLGVEFAFEAIGQKSTAQQAIAMIGRSGTCVIVGMLPPGETVDIAGSDLLLDKRILGCRMGSNRFRIDIPRYVDLYLQGRLRIDDLVSETLTFDEINRGFESMRLGRGARSVVVMREAQ